jgi:hypothetical protein
MQDDQLALLVEDMKSHGFDPRFPIVLYEGMVLAGRDRYRAALAAGVQPVFVELGPGEDPEAFVVRENELRKQFTREFLQAQRQQRLARVAYARQEGKSLRAIACQEKRSHEQIRKDLKTATVNGLTVEPPDGKTKGKDGRLRPSRRSGTGKRNAISNAAAKDESSTSAAPGDGHGRDELGLPLEGLAAEAFLIRGKFAEAARLHKQLSALVDEIAQSPGGEVLREKCILQERDGRQTFYLDRLREAARELACCAPYTCKCPYCHNKAPGHQNQKDCHVCHGYPYVTAGSFQQSPRDYQEAVEETVR